METDKSGITEEVAAFVEIARFEDFPREAHHIGKRCIIDGIGVILAGAAEPCALIVRDYILSMGGREESSLLGQGKESGAGPPCRPGKRDGRPRHGLG